MEAAGDPGDYSIFTLYGKKLREISGLELKELYQKAKKKWDETHPEEGKSSKEESTSSREKRIALIIETSQSETTNRSQGPNDTVGYTVTVAEPGGINSRKSDAVFFSANTTEKGSQERPRPKTGVAP